MFKQNGHRHRAAGVWYISFDYTQVLTPGGWGCGSCDRCDNRHTLKTLLPSETLRGKQTCFCGRQKLGGYINRTYHRFPLRDLDISRQIYLVICMIKLMPSGSRIICMIWDTFTGLDMKDIHPAQYLRTTSQGLDGLDLICLTRGGLRRRCTSALSVSI